MRQEPVRGGYGFRCSWPALALPLRTTRRHSFRSPSVHRGWATQVNPSSANFVIPCPPAPGPSLHGCPKAGLGGQAFVSFLSPVNRTLASSSPSLRILELLFILTPWPGASTLRHTCPLWSTPFLPSGSAKRLNKQPRSAGFPRKVAEGLGSIRGMDSNGRILRSLQVGAVRGSDTSRSGQQAGVAFSWGSLELCSEGPTLEGAGSAEQGAGVWGLGSKEGGQEDHWCHFLY